MPSPAMMFNCDHCHDDYAATASNAEAHLYVKDQRCNHLTTKCALCGRGEVIFLGAEKFTQAVKGGALRVHVNAEADGDLRVRAERAWAAVEEATKQRKKPTQGAGTTTEAPPATVQTYELTQRHEEEVARFSETLGNMPDALLDEGWADDTERPYPTRWTD